MLIEKAANMLIVEGPDGSGKSTLIEQLLDALPQLQLKERHADTHGPITDLVRWVNEDRFSAQTSLYDRHPLISEPIYGGIIRGNLEGKFNNPGWLTGAYKTLIHRWAMVIFCLPPLSQVVTNVIASEQMTQVAQLSGPIYQAYHTMQCQMSLISGIRSVRWDYTEVTIHDLRELIEEIRGRFYLE